MYTRSILDVHSLVKNNTMEYFPIGIEPFTTPIFFLYLLMKQMSGYHYQHFFSQIRAKIQSVSMGSGTSDGVAARDGKRRPSTSRNDTGDNFQRSWVCLTWKDDLSLYAFVVMHWIICHSVHSVSVCLKKHWNQTHVGRRTLSNVRSLER
jgi:hypothetical protein